MNVTTAVFRDIFGLAVLRTKVDNVWHYFNQIDGQRVDLTDSQFTASGAHFVTPHTYADAPTDRDAALEGFPQRESGALREAFLSGYGTRL